MTLLAALLVAGAFAAEPDLSCVKKGAEPKTLSGLMSCHSRKLAKASAAYAAKTGAEPGDSVLDAWQDAQRAEVRDYLARHPDRASLDDGKPAAAPPADKNDAEASKSPSAKASDGDAAALEQTLKAESDDGKKGVTPEMARQVVEYLTQKQGSVSPDMQDLLNSLQKEGPNLSTETMNKVKAAVQAARADGMDLKVDQKTQDFLLSPPETGNPVPAPPTSGM